ncbi:hypothetical protein [Thioflexithrix psekupsensis]|uniref:Yip1 domain-containing protein n=1 Tax=Thioflexithrix psekupsensis TaxID=1570016 RepID=A0A251X7E0_9GAMM|nr:hypothetical protein [Thioflexithrix psekupsensis]OUD13850.1 hypothetical protein TPSD3_05745 [Thioflexithrix psekupsensis]
MMNLMELVRPFWAICRLQRGPQDLPAAGVLLGLVAILHWIVNTFLFLSQTPALRAVGLSGLEAVGLMVLMYGLLWFLGKTARFVQTATAFFGCALIIEGMNLPFVYWFVQAQRDEADISLPLLVILGLTIWLLVVYGHILRHALNVSMGMGIMLAFTLSVLLSTLLRFGVGSWV